METFARYLGGVRRRQRRGGSSQTSRPLFMLDVVAADGRELAERLVDQGVSCDEVILKYCWPRYIPPATSGLRSIMKSESLVLQFERLIAMHRVAPSSIPLPVATVKSPDGAFAGYLLEYVTGETLRDLIAVGMIEEVERQLRLVESVIARLHARRLPHGDINTSNVIVADDGRTLLIDPVANPQPGTELQDRLCLAQIRREIEDAATRAQTVSDTLGI